MAKTNNEPGELISLGGARRLHEFYIEWQPNGWPLEGHQRKYLMPVPGIVVSTIVRGQKLVDNFSYVLTSDCMGWAFCWDIEECGKNYAQ